MYPKKVKGLKVAALYNYQSRTSGDLSFAKDEIIDVLSQESQDWWVGKKHDGKTGTFPVNYVEVIEGEAQLTEKQCSAMKPGTPEWDTLLSKIKNNDSSITSIDLSFLTSVVFSQNEYPTDSKNSWYMALQQTGSAFQGNTAVTTLVFGGSNVYDHPCFLEYLIEILKNSAVSNLNFKSTADEVKILSDDPRVEAHFGSKSYRLSGDMPARLTKRVALASYITMINSLLQKNTERAASKTIRAAAIEQETEALQKLDTSVKSQFASQKKEVEQIVAKSQVEIIKQETEALQKLDGSVKSQFASQKKEVEQIVAKSQAEIIKQETEALQKLDGSVKSQFASQKKEVEQSIAKSQAAIIEQETGALQKLEATVKAQLIEQTKVIQQLDANLKEQSVNQKKEPEILQNLDSLVQAQFTEQAKAIQQQDAVMKEQFANQKKEVDLAMAKMLEQLQQLPSNFAMLQSNLLLNVGQIVAAEVSRLQTEMSAQLQAEQQKVVSQVKRLNVVDPKLVDKCVSKGDFDLLHEIILDPNVDKKMLCLIHWADRFTENKVELEEQGVMFSLEALKTAIEKHLRLPSYDSRGRHHLKRLLNGCHQVLSSWQQNQLQNSAVKKELDDIAIGELLLNWRQKTDAGISMPHVSMYTQELVRQEADGWFKQELETTRQNELDEAIRKSIWSKWKVNSNGEDFLSLEMQRKVQQVLVEHFHAPETKELPQAVKDAANEETICELICNNLKQHKLDTNLSKYISSKTKEISDAKYQDGELFISNEAIVNDVIHALYQEWLSNHVTVELASKINLQVGIVLYEAFNKMDGIGSIRENIDKEALQLLLVEFRENKLSEDVKVEMENHIRNSLVSRQKLTNFEKEKVLQRLLDEWKDGTVPSSDVLSLPVLMPKWTQRIECLSQHLRAPHSGMFRPVPEVYPSTLTVAPESANTPTA